MHNAYLRTRPTNQNNSPLQKKTRQKPQAKRPSKNWTYYVSLAHVRSIQIEASQWFSCLVKVHSISARLHARAEGEFSISTKSRVTLCVVQGAKKPAHQSLKFIQLRSLGTYFFLTHAVRAMTAVTVKLLVS